MNPTEKFSSRLAWTSVTILTLVSILSFADRQIPSIMIGELSADLLLNDTQIGLISGTLFAIFFGIASVLFGWLADKANRRTVLILAILGWSILTGLCGLAQQFWDLAIYRTGVGIGEAALGPIAYSVLAGFFPKERLPLALGVLGTAPFLGSAVTAWGGAALLTDFSIIKIYLGPLSDLADWRLTFFTFGLIGLIVSLSVKILPIPERKTGATSENISLVPYLKIAWKFLLLMFLGVTITGLVGYAVLMWGIEILLRVHEIPKTVGGKYFALFNVIFGIGGSLGAGIIASNFIKKGILNAHLRLAAFMVILIWLSLFPFALSDNISLSLMGLAGMILFMSCGPGLYGSAIQNASPEELRGRTASFYFISANVIGFALGPFSLGFLNDYIFNAKNGYDETGIRYSVFWLGFILYPIAVMSFFKASQLFLPLQREVEDTS